MVPGGGHRFGRGIRRGTEGHEVGLVAHQEIGEARQKAGIVGGLTQHVGLQSAQRQKTRQHVRLICQPAKYGGCRFLRIFAGIVFVFWISQHFSTEVTYFETKSI